MYIHSILQYNIAQYSIAYIYYTTGHTTCITWWRYSVPQSVYVRMYLHKVVYRGSMYTAMVEVQCTTTSVRTYVSSQGGPHRSYVHSNGEGTVYYNKCMYVSSQGGPHRSYVHSNGGGTVYYNKCTYVSSQGGLHRSYVHSSGGGTVYYNKCMYVSSQGGLHRSYVHSNGGGTVYYNKCTYVSSQGGLHRSYVHSNGGGTVYYNKCTYVSSQGGPYRSYVHSNGGGITGRSCLPGLSITGVCSSLSLLVMEGAVPERNALLWPKFGIESKEAILELSKALDSSKSAITCTDGDHRTLYVN